MKITRIDLATVHVTERVGVIDSSCSNPCLADRFLVDIAIYAQHGVVVDRSGHEAPPMATYPDSTTVMGWTSWSAPHAAKTIGF